jgi:hypothetical protein
MRVVEYYRRRGSIGVLQLVYACFELRDGILEHLGACSALAVRVLTVIRPIRSTAWAADRADTIALLIYGREKRNVVRKTAAER